MSVAPTRAPDVCVLMPTYNNAGTLEDVVQRTRSIFRGRILVVDDGSTDSTSTILRGIAGIDVFTIAVNGGKGRALRAGFARAFELGHTHAITIDTDAQHDPADIPSMLAAVVGDPSAMVMGVRNMAGAGVPGRSSFGNNISTLCFKVETGITLQDTQTGFRAWPLEPLRRFRWITDGFGFEVEAIVKLAWHGTPFVQVPVSVRYDMPDRVSHFKPVRDFARISVLNTWLITLAIVWHWPKRLFFQGGLRKAIRSEAVRPGESSLRKAVAIGFGFFMGIVPIWGFQLLVGIPLAYAFRLNRVLFLAAAHISVPPMIPLILYASYVAGAPFVGGDAFLPADPLALDLDDIQRQVMQYVIGSMVLATGAGLVGAAISYPIITSIRRKREALP